jgi:hypothetical protein
VPPWESPCIKKKKLGFSGVKAAYMYCTYVATYALTVAGAFPRAARILSSRSKVMGLSPRPLPAYSAYRSLRSSGRLVVLVHPSASFAARGSE